MEEQGFGFGAEVEEDVDGAEVGEEAPDAVYGFDHFHLVKLINEALDKVRRRIVNQDEPRKRRRV